MSFADWQNTKEDGSVNYIAAGADGETAQDADIALSPEFLAWLENCGEKIRVVIDTPRRGCSLSVAREWVRDVLRLIVLDLAGDAIEAVTWDEEKVGDETNKIWTAYLANKSVVVIQSIHVQRFAEE